MITRISTNGTIVIAAVLANWSSLFFLSDNTKIIIIITIIVIVITILKIAYLQRNICLDEKLTKL